MDGPYAYPIIILLHLGFSVDRLFYLKLILQKPNAPELKINKAYLYINVKCPSMGGVHELLFYCFIVICENLGWKNLGSNFEFLNKRITFNLIPSDITGLGLD